MSVSEFERIREQASRIVDRLGMPIDEGILETVVALRAHNINTTASCEGHSDRVTGGPYVMFEAPGVRPYEDAYRAIKDYQSTDYQKAYNKARAMNLAEVRKVITLLDGFYKTKTIPAGQRIIIDFFASFAGRLICQGADIARILPPSEQRQLLKKNQAEMRAFTEYLIAKKLRPLVLSE